MEMLAPLAQAAQLRSQLQQGQGGGCNLTTQTPPSSQPPRQPGRAASDAGSDGGKSHGTVSAVTMQLGADSHGLTEPASSPRESPSPPTPLAAG
eukprot:5840495-Pyramimonas_sp.AAC.1